MTLEKLPLLWGDKYHYGIKFEWPAEDDLKKMSPHAALTSIQFSGNAIIASAKFFFNDGTSSDEFGSRKEDSQKTLSLVQ